MLKRVPNGETTACFMIKEPLAFDLWNQGSSVRTPRCWLIGSNFANWWSSRCINSTGGVAVYDAQSCMCLFGVWRLAPLLRAVSDTNPPPQGALFLAPGSETVEEQLDV